MIDFQRIRFTFPPTKGQAQSATLAASFPSHVLRADAAISGFDIGYTQSDHHLLRTQVDLKTSIVTDIEATIVCNMVKVTVNFLLRDGSGNFDDPYNGFVEVLVIVDRV